VFSFGVILLELLAGEYTFPDNLTRRQKMYRGRVLIHEKSCGSGGPEWFDFRINSNSIGLGWVE
jgi:hypothetical protein